MFISFRTLESLASHSTYFGYFFRSSSNKNKTMDEGTVDIRGNPIKFPHIQFPYTDYCRPTIASIFGNPSEIKINHMVYGYKNCVCGIAVSFKIVCLIHPDDVFDECRVKIQYPCRYGEITTKLCFPTMREMQKKIARICPRLFHIIPKGEEMPEALKKFVEIEAWNRLRELQMADRNDILFPFSICPDTARCRPEIEPLTIFERLSYGPQNIITGYKTCICGKRIYFKVVCEDHPEHTLQICKVKIHYKQTEFISFENGLGFFSIKEFENKIAIICCYPLRCY